MTEALLTVSIHIHPESQILYVLPIFRTAAKITLLYMTYLLCIFILIKVENVLPFIKSIPMNGAAKYADFVAILIGHFIRIL